MTASAEENATSGTCGDNLNWTLEDGVLTISGTGEMEDYSYGDAPWYTDQENIISIVIKDGVTSIADYAFYICENLESVTIPSSVTSIGRGAFSLCISLTEIEIPNGVLSIERGAFEGASLTSVALPASVQYVDSTAFIPNFGTAGGVQEILVDSENANYKSVDGVLYTADGTELVTYPANQTDSTYEILDGVQVIQKGAFCGAQSLTEIICPDSLTTIEDMAFASCTALTAFTMPDSVIKVGGAIFCECESLATLTLSNQLTELPSSGNVGLIWENCMGAVWCDFSHLAELTIPYSITHIPDDTLGGMSNLANITILNPDCEIDDSPSTICTSYNEGDPYFTGTIYGYTDSTAQIYAKTYGYKFIPLDGTFDFADLDGDDAITISDAFLCLTAYANSAAGNDDGLTEAQREAADVDGDGSITIMDASYILQFYAQTAAGNNPTWEDIISA